MRNTKLHNKTKKRILSATLVLSLLATLINPCYIMADEGSSSEPETGAHGSGSYHLNKVAQDSRFYTEYYVEAKSGKTYTVADITRRTSINVYAKAGEVILFGSSVSNSEITVDNKWNRAVTDADIVITTPSKTKIPFDVLAPGEKDKVTGTVRPNGYGYIANPTQEKYGPMVNHMDEKDPQHKYYVPLTYQATQDGVYTFEFHSRTGYNDGTSPTKVTAGSTRWNQNNTTVAAWDVTVLGAKAGDATKWEVKSGRAWADYLALTTGDGSAVADLDVHILTHDGYIYKVDFNRAAPFGFIFFANNTGFMSTMNGGDASDGTAGVTHYPIYHSFYDSTNDLDDMETENILLHKPNAGDTTTEETYKIFFNRPNEDLQGVEYVEPKDGKTVTMKVKPDDSVTISNLKFTGIEENIAHSGHGGKFTFTSSGEAMIAITLDLRKAIFDSEISIEEYDGSGIVELTAPAHAGDNVFYWDGKDTDGITIPSGVYGNLNVYIATEVKRGEIHFPVIDMEGLSGGLKIQRLNKASSETDASLADSAYNLYYNNNPLAYGTIEGKSVARVLHNGYNYLSDGTKSFNIAAERGGINFFKTSNQISISTLMKDDQEYLCQKLFGISYTDPALTSEQKAIIDAEFGKEFDTFHFEPVDSSTTSMTFSSSGYYGGGNQAGIDAWTYYSQGVIANAISFAVLDPSDLGIVRGQIFYDANKNSQYDTGAGATDYPLANMQVHLIDKDGQPLTHEKELPCFDDKGFFIYDENGNIKHEKRTVAFETITDANGNYRFTGVPYNKDDNEEFYVQVMLTESHSELMRYTCTTSDYVKNTLTSSGGGAFHSNTINTSEYGADGNKWTSANAGDKLYGYRYDRDLNKETIFDDENANNRQNVFLNSSSVTENGIHIAEFKKIGYCSAVPEENQVDYKVHIDWGTNSQGKPTHEISDGVTVELYVWNEEHHTGDGEVPLSRRTGTLLDTQVATAQNGWNCIWKNLDNRLQYYVLEYYTKKKESGEVIYNDKGEPRLVLIGGTMPVYDKDQIPNDPHTGLKREIYGFNTQLGDYPTQEIPTGSGIYRIPIQSFQDEPYADADEYENSITKQEKLDSVNNNSRQYYVNYRVVEEDGGKTNTFYLKNCQVYDDRTYYVWLNHQTVLPDLIAQTYVEHKDGTHVKKSHALELQKDVLIDADKDEWSIKGLSVSSMDAASVDNVEGNSTNAFRINSSTKSNALFTANKQGSYKTGTGTRTYLVKYVVTNDTTKAPVSVKANSAGKLVLASDGTTLVENNTSYIVYSWFMTIHVYDVQSDGVFKYDPKDGTVTLQEALDVKNPLTWTRTLIDGNENNITYTSDDPRNKGLLYNDTLRVPMYKTAVEPDMGSCADIVGIAWAGSKTVADPAGLEYSDTYESRYGITSMDLYEEDDDSYSGSLDGTANAYGDGGVATVQLGVERSTMINRVQDHANYAEVTFTPKQHRSVSSAEPTTDVFYYKVVVFSEDITYQFNGYDEIDATEGVVMYASFTMQSTALPDEDSDDSGEPLDSVPKMGDPAKGTTPWVAMMGLGMMMVAVVEIRRKRVGRF